MMNKIAVTAAMIVSLLLMSWVSYRAGYLVGYNDGRVDEACVKGGE